ncbi:MAG TPA: hypothetical protein PK095_10835 [Myxococcota bacterium]|nr:hypothetical protein [Myxococcota bacterium]
MPTVRCHSSTPTPAAPDVVTEGHARPSTVGVRGLVALLAAMWLAACDSNPTPHPGQPDVYSDTVDPNIDRDPENPNAGADAVEVQPLDPDATDPTQGYEDDHCDTHDATSPDADALTDAAHPDAGPTDTSDPCDPNSRGNASGEIDSDFSTANPPPTGPR